MDLLDNLMPSIKVQAQNLIKKIKELQVALQIQAKLILQRLRRKLKQEVSPMRRILTRKNQIKKTQERIQFKNMLMPSIKVQAPSQIKKIKEALKIQQKPMKTQNQIEINITVKKPAQNEIKPKLMLQNLRRN